MPFIAFYYFYGLTSCCSKEIFGFGNYHFCFLALSQSSRLALYAVCLFMIHSLRWFVWDDITSWSFLSSNKNDMHLPQAMEEIFYEG